MNPEEGKSTNCPCDEQTFPAPRKIAAGLGTLPRHLATFPQFRAAMLAAIPSRGPLALWRARSSADFGIMLLEMWAYVCDCIAFYDQVRADESYIRTAQLRPSVRMLTDLLGYVPRPAVAAVVDLAVLADGRQPVTLPMGTAFRSGAFPGGTPQIFELTAPAIVHPFFNQWTVAPVRPTTIGEPRVKGPPVAIPQHPAFTQLLLDPKTNILKKGSIFLFEVLGDPKWTAARTVRAIGDFTAEDGVKYTRIEWDDFFRVPAGTALSSIRISTPTRVAHLTTKTSIYGYKAIYDSYQFTVIVLDALYNNIGLDSSLILERDSDVRPFKVTVANKTTLQVTPPTATKVKDSKGNLVSTVEALGSTADVNWLLLDARINDSARKLSGAADWDATDAPAINVHYAFIDAATVVRSAWSTIIQSDPLVLMPPVELPQNGKTPGRFLLEDNNGGAFRTLRQRRLQVRDREAQSQLRHAHPR